MIGWLVVAGTLLAAPPGGVPVAGVSAPGVPAPGVPAPLPAGAGMAAPAVPGREPVSPDPDRWIAEDKARHFALSFAATGMTYGGARLALDPEPGRRAAAGIALLLGVGKELLDVREGGPFSLKDLAWDAAGVALGFLFAQQIR